jgi:hypothetical protein
MEIFDGIKLSQELIIRYFFIEEPKFIEELKIFIEEPKIINRELLEH